MQMSKTIFSTTSFKELRCQTVFGLVFKKKKRCSDIVIPLTEGGLLVFRCYLRGGGMGYSPLSVQQDGNTEEKCTLHKPSVTLAVAFWVFFPSREQIRLERVMRIFPLEIPVCTSWTLLSEEDRI